MKKLILFALLLPALLLAQQPQTGTPDPQGLQGINSKWTNGVGPGYWPYQKTGTCTGLNLCISAGTVPQCMGSSHVTYAGTTSFALTNNATNYIYLDLDNSCVPAVNTSGYSNRNIAIAKVVTSGGSVTSISDDRFWGSSEVVLGAVDAQTGTSYTIANTDRNKLVTLSNASAIAVTLPTTLGASFTVAIQNIGAGSATLTPSSGTVNGAANIILTGGTGSTGQGAWLFFDGTNWEGVMGSSSAGGGGGSAIKECIVTTGDPGAASPVLADDNDSPGQCGNDFGADITIIAVAGCRDAGSPTVTPILTGGSGTSILTGAMTVSGSCSGGTWTAGTVNGSPVIHPFNSNGATCSSTPCTLDSNITTAGGSAKYVVMKYTATTSGGTTTAMNMGTASNHQLLYDNAGSVGGVSNGTAGQVAVSQGTGATPAFAGCLLSNGVTAKTTNYTLAAADDGALVTFNGTSLTATLANPAPNSTWCANIMNLSPSTNLTVSRNSLNINTGTTNLTLLPYQSTTVWTDGSNYFATTPFAGVSTTTASQTPSINNVNGASVPTSAKVLGSNGSAQLVADTAHDMMGPLTCHDTSGSGTAQSCTTSPSLTPTCSSGQCTTILYSTTTTNTGDVTLNVDSTSAVHIRKWLGTAVLASGDLQANVPELLTYDGTYWEAYTIGNAPSGGGGCGSVGNPGACLLEEHTVSGASNSAFTSCFSSSYDVYLVTMQDVVMSASSTRLEFQFSTNGGSTWVTTNYSYSGWRIDITGASGGDNGNSVSFIDVGIGLALLTTNSPGWAGSFNIYNPLSSSMAKHIANGSGFGPAQGFNPNFRTFGGYQTSTSAMNAFQIFPSSGTFSGTFRCYGLSK